MHAQDASADHLDRDALARLRALIAEAAVAPHLPLPPERDLSTRFGIGRRAIRQALAALEAEGRVWRRQGKGTFAAPVAAVVAPTLTRMAARTSFGEVMEVRLAIEPVLAEHAALRAAPEQVTLMRRLADRTTTQTVATSAADLEHWDAAFHRCIAEAAGNRLFLDLFEMVDRIRHDPAWRRYRARARTPERLTASGAQHVAVAEAVARHDGAEAARVMRLHIAALCDALGEALNREGLNGDVSDDG